MDLNALVPSSWTVKSADSNAGLAQSETIQFLQTTNGITIRRMNDNSDWATSCSFLGSSLTGHTSAGAAFTITFDDPAPTLLSCRFAAIGPQRIRNGILSAFLGALIGAVAASVARSQLPVAITVGAAAGASGSLMFRGNTSSATTGTSPSFVAEDKGAGMGKHPWPHHHHAATA